MQEQLYLSFLESAYADRIAEAESIGADRLQAVLSAQQRQLRLFARTLHDSAKFVQSDFADSEITLPLSADCISSIHALSETLQLSCVDFIELAVSVLETAFDHDVLQRVERRRTGEVFFRLVGVNELGRYIELTPELHTPA